MLWWWLLHAALAVVGTGLARRYALARRLLDQPGARRSHSTATPRGGGIAIVVALLVAALALAIRDPQQRTLMVAFAVGLVLVAGIGMVDDHRPLSPWLRLCVHALAAAVFAAALVLAGGGAAMAIVAFVTIVALTNIWNFMDGIDGIAASQAMLLGLVLTMVAGGSWGLLGAALAAACLGFLPWNFPWARIFLGDVGSGAIGFAIAAVSAVATARQGPIALLLLLPLSAFLIDAGLTLSRRFLRGEPWWTAHTQHAYQVWARRVGHRRVTLAFAGWTMAGGGLLWWLRGGAPEFIGATVLAWYTSGAVAWWVLQRMETRPGTGHTGGGSGRQG